MLLLKIQINAKKSLKIKQKLIKIDRITKLMNNRHISHKIIKEIFKISIFFLIKKYLNKMPIKKVFKSSKTTTHSSYLIEK